MNNKLIIVIAVVVLVLGGFLFFKNTGVAPTETMENEMGEVTEVNNVANEVVNETVPTSQVVSVKGFMVESVPFSYSPSTMTVDRGDTVTITLKNTKGTHDLKIDEFGVATRILKEGEEQTITFVADKAGTFEYYCSIGNHRSMGMVGKLIVR